MKGGASGGRQGTNQGETMEFAWFNLIGLAAVLCG
jgi:hypothetical protein